MSEGIEEVVEFNVPVPRKELDRWVEQAVTAWLHDWKTQSFVSGHIRDTLGPKLPQMLDAAVARMLPTMIEEEVRTVLKNRIRHRARAIPNHLLDAAVQDEAEKAAKGVTSEG